MYPSLPINFNNKEIDNDFLETPKLGEHTKEILINIALNKKEINKMIEDKIIFSSK